MPGSAAQRIRAGESCTHNVWLWTSAPPFGWSFQQNQTIEQRGFSLERTSLPWGHCGHLVIRDPSKGFQGKNITARWFLTLVPEALKFLRRHLVTLQSNQRKKCFQEEMNFSPTSGDYADSASEKTFPIFLIFAPMGSELFGEWKDNRTIYLMRSCENSTLEMLEACSLLPLSFIPWSQPNKNSVGLPRDRPWRTESSSDTLQRRSLYSRERWWDEKEARQSGCWAFPLKYLDSQDSPVLCSLRQWSPCTLKVLQFPLKPVYYSLCSHFFPSLWSPELLLNKNYFPKNLHLFSTLSHNCRLFLISLFNNLFINYSLEIYYAWGIVYFVANMIGCLYCIPYLFCSRLDSLINLHSSILLLLLFHLSVHNIIYK